MTSTVKTCFKCHVRKPITEFYVHPQMGDGRLNKCKECTKADVRKNYADNIEHYQSYERGRRNLPHRVEARKEYAQTDRGREAARRAHENFRRRFPEKARAHDITNNAIRDGRLIRKPCEVCGTTADVEAHHDDYTKPLNVRWLCVTHHVEHHNNRRGAA